MKVSLVRQSGRTRGGKRLMTWYRQTTSGISKNVQILVLTEPLWAIPVTWTRTYASLFMAALGLTATQIGWVTSLVLITQMLIAPLGGYVADRFGRKRVLIIFDTLSWILPTVLWMLAQNLWFFIAAAFLNGLSLIVFPSWNCLLVEDTEPERRPAVFAAFQLVVLGAGLFSPVAGWIVADYTVVTGSRILYALAFLSITTMVLIRGLTLKETSVGSALSQQMRGTRIQEVLKGYRAILVQGMRNHTLVLLFFLVMINFAYMTIWTTYSALYMTHQKGLGLNPALVALWPTFSSLVMILTLVLLVPRVQLERLPHWLLLSSSVLCSGMLLFLLTPPGCLLVLAVAAIFIGVGTALMNPVRDTYIAGIIADRERAVIMAGMNSLSMVFVAPLTPLAGRLFEFSPRIPLLLLLGMLTAGALLSSILWKKGTLPTRET